MATNALLDLSGLNAVSSYEPNELIITVQAGAPLADVQSLIDAKNQQFAFEPVDVSVLLGNGDGSFGVATNFTAGIDPGTVTIADLNGDGALDLAVANLGRVGVGPGSVSVLLGDGSAEFTEAVGLTVDRISAGMGIRSQRYSMLVEDGVVKQLNFEPSGEYGVSGGEAMLAKL